MRFLEIVLETVAFLLLLPAAILFVEILLAATKPAYLPGQRGERRRLAVLVPAHDEASIIEGTIRSIVPQLNESDRLLVVADNCADDTAAVARSAGAEVV